MKLFLGKITRACTSLSKFCRKLVKRVHIIHTQSKFAYLPRFNYVHLSNSTGTYSIRIFGENYDNRLGYGCRQFFLYYGIMYV